MYFRANAFQNVQGDCYASPQVAAVLRGSPAAPTRLEYPFHTRIRRQVIGLRARLAEGGDPATLAIELDGRPVARWQVAGRERLEHFLAPVEIPRAAAAHTLSVIHTGPGAVLLHDLIVRWAGSGGDLMNDELTIEEGRHWSEHLEVHVAAGDRSIIDGAVKGTHRAFLVLGIREPDRRDLGREFGLWSRRETAFAFGPFRERPGGLGLDLGCGAGQFALQAARQGTRMIGVDLGAGMLEIGRAHAATQPGVRVDYVRAECERLPFRPERFDVVASKESLHHVSDVRTAFREIRRILKADGIFIAMDHVRVSSFLDRTFMALRGWLRPRMMRRFPLHPIPQILMYDSPLEDSGAGDLLPAFEASFSRRRRIRRLGLVPVIWAHAWYAYGRLRPLLLPLWLGLVWLIEIANMLAAGPTSLGLRGEGKR